MNQLRGEKDIVPIESLESLLVLSQTNENAFYLKFVDVYPIFFRKICSHPAKLSISEVKFCMFLKLKYSTKRIAMYTKTTIKSVEGRKYRLKKKLSLAPEDDLYSYINLL